MTILALVQPTDLLGREMRDALARRRDLWRDVRLLTTDDDEVGTLTEIGGGAALVQRLDPDDLRGAGCAVFCGPIEETRALLPALDPGATAIILSRGANLDDGVPIVAGVNLERARRGEILVSPHPGVVGLTNLLAPLLALEPTRATATLLAPASFTGAHGLEEVLEQTRGILAFHGDWPREVFGAQMAFNMLPENHDDGDLGRTVEKLLGGSGTGGRSPICALTSIRASVFHGCSLSVHVSFAADPGAERIAELLAGQPLIEVVEDPDDLGPIRAAARDEILVGRIEPSAGGYWLWAVFDNLTVGGAQNALAVLEAILATEIH